MGKNRPKNKKIARKKLRKIEKLRKNQPKLTRKWKRINNYEQRTPIRWSKNLQK